MTASTMPRRPGEPEREGLPWLCWMLRRWWVYGASALSAADVRRALEIADAVVEADEDTCPKDDPDCYGPANGSHEACDRTTFPVSNPFRDVPCGVQIVDGVARPVPWAGDPIPPNHEVVHRDELARLRRQPDLEWHRRIARSDVPALVGLAIGAGIVVGYLICWLKGVS